MARWTGHEHIESVLEGADAWRQKCLLEDRSLFTDRALWTSPLLSEILTRFTSLPIEGSSRDFLDKLAEQMKGEPEDVIFLVAEVIWFLLLFPSSSAMRPETKRRAIETVYGWVGAPLPSSALLDDEHLVGVGNPGTAYLTRRPAEFEYIVRTVIAFKALPLPRRRELLRADGAWDFAHWVDEQQGSDRRLGRNVVLYFVFPEQFERIVSREHKKQIYESLKGKLPREKHMRGRARSLLDYDKAIFDIREALARERGNTNVDFYDDEYQNQWYSSYRDAHRKNFASWLDTYLKDRGLRLNQSGRDTTIEKLREDDAIAPDTGYWSEDSGLTAKPPRWLIHFDLTAPALEASVPGAHRARVVGFANTKGGDSGALGVRILPVVKVAENSYQVIEAWEWLLLFCFPSGLKPGSAAQAFDDFDPSTGVLTYMGERIPYIFAGLFCLNGPEQTFSAQIGSSLKTMTYREATDCLARLINVDVGVKNA